MNHASKERRIVPVKTFCRPRALLCTNSVIPGGSPGLVIMGRDSRSEGRGFESRHCILDGHFHIL